MWLIERVEHTLTLILVKRAHVCRPLIDGITAMTQFNFVLINKP